MFTLIKTAFHLNKMRKIPAFHTFCFFLKVTSKINFSKNMKLLLFGIKEKYVQFKELSKVIAHVITAHDKK